MKFYWKEYKNYLGFKLIPKCLETTYPLQIWFLQVNLIQKYLYSHVLNGLNCSS